MPAEVGLIVKTDDSFSGFAEKVKIPNRPEVIFVTATSAVIVCEVNRS